MRHEKPFDAFDLSADGKFLASAGFEGITVWDVVRRKRLRTIETEVAYWIAAAPDGKTLVSVGKDKFIHLWDTATGKEVRQFAQGTENVSAFSFAPDGNPTVRRWPRPNR